MMCEFSKIQGGQRQVLHVLSHRKPMDTERELLLLMTVAFNRLSGEPLHFELNGFVYDDAHRNR
jgi:hypothetical protein